MKRLLKFILIFFLGFSSQTSFCQDTSKPAFRIVKIYATSAGIANGIVDRDALVDSGGIVIHGCPDCRVEGFQMKITYADKTILKQMNDLTDNVIKDTLLKSRTTDSIVYTPKVISTQPMMNVNPIQSKSDLFTPEMKYWIGYNDNDYVSSSVEISNIKVITPEGKTNTLDKIYLLLK